MTNEVEFSLTREKLSDGTPEEQATFGVFSLRAAHASLTEGFDFFLGGYRPGPLVPAYHVANWIAWNWWRLRWEPRTALPDWARSHSMNVIGEGYLWPNIEMWSDGVRSVILSKPSERADAKPFRYVGSHPIILPSTTLEVAIDDFMSRALSLLADGGLHHTNLDLVWNQILADRLDPSAALYRRLEALMSADPGEIDETVIQRLLADSERLGLPAVEELAAAKAQACSDDFLIAADYLEAIAAAEGFKSDLRDISRLRSTLTSIQSPTIPPGTLGGILAKELRTQESLGFGPISNKKLAEISGVSSTAISRASNTQINFSFTLANENQIDARVVLRARNPVMRRFALARLLGDYVYQSSGAMHPATDAGTYRQKVQRSFAAELLSPFDVVEELLAGDLSVEKQQEVAEHFDVSPITINRLLINHGRIDRPGEIDPDVMAA